jgi:hypothetical protein
LVQNQSKNGIFLIPSQLSILHHIPFSKCFGLDSFEFTSSHISTIGSSHIFLSSVLQQPEKVNLFIESIQQFHGCIGIVTHTVEKIHPISVIFSLDDKSILVNGVKKNNFQFDNGSVELCFNPQQHKILFGLSQSKKRIFSMNLPQIPTSFVLLCQDFTSISFIFHLNLLFLVSKNDSRLSCYSDLSLL